MKLLTIILFLIGGGIFINVFILNDQAIKKENSTELEESGINRSTQLQKVNNGKTILNNKTPQKLLKSSTKAKVTKQKKLTVNDIVIKKSEVSVELINKITQEFESVLNRRPTDKEILKMLKLKKLRRIQEKEYIQESIQNKENLEDIQQATNQEINSKIQNRLKKDKRIIQLLKKDELTNDEKEELELIRE